MMIEHERAIDRNEPPRKKKSGELGHILTELERGQFCKLFAGGMGSADLGNVGDQVPRLLIRDEAGLLRQEHNAFID